MLPLRALGFRMIPEETSVCAAPRKARSRCSVKEPSLCSIPAAGGGTCCLVSSVANAAYLAEGSVSQEGDH